MKYHWLQLQWMKHPLVTTLRALESRSNPERRKWSGPPCLLYVLVLKEKKELVANDLEST